MSVSLRRPNIFGDVSWCKAQIVDKRFYDDTHIVDLEISGLDVNNDLLPDILRLLYERADALLVQLLATLINLAVRDPWVGHGRNLHPAPL